jgi:hypothetical protein
VRTIIVARIAVGGQSGLILLCYNDNICNLLVEKASVGLCAAVCMQTSLEGALFGP